MPMIITNNEIPDELALRFKKGKVTLFIGAGCSMSAGLPGWNELYLDEYDIHERILQGAGRLSKDKVKAGERKLLTILPLEYKKTDNFEMARNLFRVSSEADPRNAHTWQAWALMEKEANNVGELETEYTARWLFRKGTEADSKDAHTWQAWALMEKEAGEHNEFGRLLKMGLDYCPDSQELLRIKKCFSDKTDMEQLELLIDQRDSLAEIQLKNLLFKNPQDPDVLKLYDRWKQNYSGV